MPAKQPISLVEAKGRKHLTKAEKEMRRESEVKANSENIVAPDYLPEPQKKEFDRLANELIDAKIMTNLDCDALGRYVSAEYQYQMITARLLKSKIVNDKYIEMAKLQDKFFKQARTAASDLGLTITSRCKIAVPKKEVKQIDPRYKEFADV